MFRFANQAARQQANVSRGFRSVRPVGVASNAAFQFARSFSTVTPASGEILNKDVVVVGAGVAGAAAALQAAECGLKVLVLTSTQDVRECNSLYAQGGIIYRGEEDSPELLGQDVHVAGAGLCTPQAVGKLCLEGPACVESYLLDSSVRCPFDLDAEGNLALCLEGGHSLPRIVHVGDATGRAITLTLQEMLRSNPNISLLPGAVAVDVLRSEGQCIGLETRQGDKTVFVSAAETVLATGGVGELYTNTSNPSTALGDGLGMALRAGCKSQGMEYVQFHPTTLALPGERRFLISEAVRGEGARLVNASGEHFAKNYHPRGELAPRDIVARMIVSEMMRTGSPHAFLDITHKGRDFLVERFPTIFNHCLARGIDMSTDLIPVVPSQHFHCGGLAVDLEGRTSMRGLRAVGEVSCTGVHGANRLASTSLLEGLVWGKATAVSIAEQLGSGYGKSSLSDSGNRAAARVAAVARDSYRVPHAGSESEECVVAVQALWSEMQDLMWTGAGILRTSGGLDHSSRELSTLHQRVGTLREQYGADLGLIRVENSLSAAEHILQSALQNRESAGGHYRVDTIEKEQMAATVAVAQNVAQTERRLMQQ